MTKQSKPIYWLLFIVYTIVLIKVAFVNQSLEMVKENIMGLSLNRLTTNLQDANFIPFKTIGVYTNMYFKPAMKFLGLGIAWFIPLGYFIPALTSARNFKRVLITGLLIIISIEVLQLVLALGVFDIDDIILNACGLILGYMVYQSFK